MSMIIDGTNGLTFNNSTTQASAGQVLQVVNATYSTQVSSSSTTFSDTGLTATITPKFATSKILVLVSQVGLGKDSADTRMQLKLLRGSTQIVYIEDIAGATSSSATNVFGGTSCNYLDSPATTSATTYKTQFANKAGTGNVYVQVFATTTPTSTITLMEIAG